MSEERDKVNELTAWEPILYFDSLLGFRQLEALSAVLQAYHDAHARGARTSIDCKFGYHWPT